MIYVFFFVQEKAIVVNDIGHGGAGAPIKSESGVVRTRLPATLDGKTAVKELNSTKDEKSQGTKNVVYEQQAYAGKKFIEKLGWSTSGQPHRRGHQAKKDYLDTLRKIISRVVWVSS